MPVAVQSSVFKVLLRSIHSLLAGFDALVRLISTHVWSWGSDYLELQRRVWRITFVNSWLCQRWSVDRKENFERRKAVPKNF